MKLEFKQIHIQNFLSIGDATINLNDNGYTLVNGNNQNPNDNAKSNGSGKSTIFEAINWCLTGETIRGSKDVINIHGNDGAVVELEFTIGSKTYNITRSKEHSKLKTNLKIYIDGEDKSGKGIRDSEKLLADYLPDLNSSLIGSVVILGQGLPQRFTNNTPSGRKEVLEKLSKSDFMIEDLKNRIASRKSTLNAAIRASEDQLLQYDSTIDLLNRQIIENQIKIDSLGTTETLDALISQLDGDILDCTIKANTYTEEYNNARTKFQELSAKKNELSSELVKFANEKNEIHFKETELNNKIRDEIDAVNSIYASTLTELNKNYTEATTELKNKQAELIKMQNVKDTCPTCGQKLPGVFKPDTTEIETAITSLTELVNNTVQTINATKAECTEKVNEVKPKYSNDFNKFTADIQAVVDKENTIRNMISDIDSESSTLSKTINEAKSNADLYKTKGENYRLKIENAKLEKEGLESKKQAALNIIESNTKQIEELSINSVKEDSNKIELEKHLEIINKMNNVITRDFRGFLLTNIIDYINKKAKEYSLEVFNTDKINFAVDGNNIAITYDEKEYENLSGGEKAKCDIIIQLSLRSMLCKYLDFSSNILVLDEIFDGLDQYGCEQILNLITRHLSDVESVFIVTHHQDLQLPSDTIITVTKDNNGISSVEITR